MRYLSVFLLAFFLVLPIQAESQENRSISKEEILSRHVAAAGHGDPEKQFLLATILETGKLSDPDPKQAIFWHHQAARQGHARAQFGLAQGLRIRSGYIEPIYYKSEHLESEVYETTSDPLDTEHLEMDVYETDTEPADGFRFQIPPPVLFDPDRLEVFRDLNRRSLANARPRNSHNLKEKHIHPFEIAGWYRKAALQGYPPAQAVYGEIHAVGLGVRRNYIAAHAWCSLSRGIERGRDCMQIVEHGMTPKQIAESENLRQKLSLQIQTR